MNKYINNILIAACCLSFLVAGCSKTTAFIFLNANMMQLAKQGKFEEALKVGRKTLDLAESAFGQEHARTRVALITLGLLYSIQGRYAEAESLLERSLEIAERSLGKEDPEVAYILVFLASNCNGQGRFPEAERLLSRALEIAEKAFGSDHPRITWFLQERANLYRTHGKYAEAEPLYRRTLEITEKAYGPEHLEVANMLSGIGVYYLYVGKYTEAESMFVRARTIREKVLGPDHYSTGRSYFDLSWLYWTQGDYARAQPLFQRSLEIAEKCYGPDHLKLAEYYQVLGARNWELGKIEESASFYQKSLAIRERAFGPDHQSLTGSLSGLARYSLSKGNFDEARSMYDRAIGILETNVGPEYWELAQYMVYLSRLRTLEHNPEAALPLMFRALRIDDKVIENVFSAASEQDKLAFLRTMTERFDVLQSLVAGELPGNPAAVRLALDAVLRRKGLVLEALSRERSTLMVSNDPLVKDIFMELRSVASSLSSQSLGGPGKLPMDEYKKRLAELESKKDSLESELARVSDSYAAKRRSRQVDVDSVLAALAPGSVLIEYVSFQLYDLHFSGAGKEKSQSHYLAFVLSAGEKTKPLLVNLGDGETIDQAIRDFRSEMAAAPRVIMREGEKKAELRLAEKSKRIYELAFAPLKKVLGKNKTLFLAPDGDLNLVPFGALQDQRGRYLIESYQLNYLSTGRDLLSFLPRESTESEVVLLADPDYDAGHIDSEVAALNSTDS
ncbi:tetratricopeptide repeat protein, partial [Gemmatimonadota bacterium]